MTLDHGTYVQIQKHLKLFGQFEMLSGIVSILCKISHSGLLGWNYLDQTLNTMKAGDNLFINFLSVSEANYSHEIPFFESLNLIGTSLV